MTLRRTGDRLTGSSWRPPFPATVRTMKVDAYMAEAEWDGLVLVLRGTTGPGRVALLGERHKDGEVRIPREHIAAVELHEPKLGGAVNGNLIVRHVDGTKYQLHYRKKQSAGVEALATALGVTP